MEWLVRSGLWTAVTLIRHSSYVWRHEVQIALIQLSSIVIISRGSTLSVADAAVVVVYDFLQDR